MLKKKQATTQNMASQSVEWLCLGGKTKYSNFHAFLLYLYNDPEELLNQRRL
jgi:hypothetical protein